MSREKHLYNALACKFSKGIGNIKGKEILEDKQKTQEILNKLTDNVKKLIDEEIVLIKKYKANTTTILDPDYPENLTYIHNAPIILYYYGILPKTFSFAIVGTRKPSKYGITTTQMIVSQLCEFKIPIISGFAYGIDTVAHQVALENNIPTIAVLGTGLDIQYPVVNTWMRKRIIDGGGAIVSEFPFGTIARPSNFPIRNRIISGLANGILIVEAAMSSGSLITAELGLEQGKNIFTIPGTLFGNSFKGNHNLIRMGGILVENGYQILDEYSEYQPLIQGKDKAITNPLFKDIKIEEPKISPKTEPSGVTLHKGLQPYKKPVNTIKSKQNKDFVDAEFDGTKMLQKIKTEKILPVLLKDELILYKSIIEPTPLEILMAKTGMTAPKTLSLLTSLILKGIVKEKGGLYYSE